MTNEIVIEADEFNEIGLTLIETTAEAAGSEEIVKLAQYTRRLQSQLAQVTQENEKLNAIVSAYENQDEEALEEARIVELRSGLGLLIGFQPAYVVDKYGQREMRSGRDLHESDCLYRTHNGKCDCALGTTINDAATRMRDRCVEQLKSLHDEYESQEYAPGAMVLSKVIQLLESLTLEGEQEKQKPVDVCVVCKSEPVCPEEGFDTCTYCARRI